MTVSAKIDEAVALEQLKLVYGQLPGGLIITVVVAAVLGGAVSTEVSWSEIIIWWFSVLFVIGVRAESHRRFQTATVTGNGAPWRSIAVVGATMAGLAWGVGGAFFAGQLSNEYLFLVLLCACGMSITSIAYLSAVSDCHRGFLLGLNVPLFIYLVMVGTEVHWLLAILLVLFMAAVSRSSSSYNRNLTESLHLRFENTRLVEELTETNRLLISDLHERDRRAEQLRMGERIFDQISHLVRLGYWVYDKTAGAYDRVSPKCPELLGISREEMLGRYGSYDTHAQLLVEEDRQRYLQIINAALMADRSYRVQYRVLTAEGQRDLIETGEVFVGQDPRRSMVVGTLQDVTDMERTERELRDSDARFRVMFGSAGVGMAHFSQTGVLLDVNEAYSRFLGYERAALLNRSVFDLYFEEDVGSAKDTLTQILRGSADTLQFERRYRHRSGEPRWGLVTISRLVSSTQAENTFLSQVQDITGRIHADRERDQLLAELEQKNAELERFAYTISHDLKGPLITVRSFASLLSEDLAANSAPRVNDDLKHILNATSQMQERLRNLLHLARVSHDRALNEAVSTYDVCLSVVDLLQGQLSMAEIDIAVSTNLPIVSGNRERLSEVFQNLIENAVKFMGDQPSPQIIVDCSDVGDMVEFYVLDNGVGIDEPLREKIFDLFVTLDAKDPSSGVGLAIVRQIIEAHHGRVWVESGEGGEGTRVVFTLPSRPAVTTQLKQFAQT